MLKQKSPVYYDFCVVYISHCIIYKKEQEGVEIRSRKKKDISELLLLFILNKLGMKAFYICGVFEMGFCTDQT